MRTAVQRAARAFTPVVTPRSPLTRSFTPGLLGQRVSQPCRGRSAFLALALFAAPLATPVRADPGDWTHLAGDATHVSVRAAVVPSLAAPAWVASVDRNHSAITFNTGTTPVTFGQHVFALGVSAGVDHLYAINRATGAVDWQQPIPAPIFGSVSTPAVDVENGTILVAAGSSLQAFAAASGTPLWSFAVQREIVNSSPVVTSDLGPSDRAFILDYSGFGASATLYCLNVDQFDAAFNPYQPGALVWSLELETGVIGTTPAYADGILYVPDSGTFTPAAAGAIRAFPATTDTAPAPLWVTPAPNGDAYYGGIAVIPGTSPILFAATYTFFGGQLNSSLVKIEATTGTVLWSVPAGRTNSIPVPLADGRIALSAGVDGFGSAPSIQLFQDLGSTASLIWDSALVTWIDADNDQQLDPGEYRPLGGFLQQPAVAQQFTGPHLIVGAPGATFDTDLSVLDLNTTPDDPAFIVAHIAAAGGPPALAGRTLYSIGAAGLYAFGSFTCPADLNADGLVDDTDFVLFAQAYDNFADPAADFNADGLTDDIDFVLFAQAYDLFVCP